MIDVLKHLSADLPLRQYYTWKMPQNVPIEIPENVDDRFDQNVYLKEHLAPQMHNCNNLDICYWIIRDWGGIKRFAKNEHNNKRIREVVDQLKKNHLSLSTSQPISSLSKLAAFWDPQQFSIYDSRAVFALNWLIMRHSSDKRIFPQPKGRGRVAKYDQKEWFAVFKNQHETRDKDNAYREYCELIRKLSLAVYGVDKPYLMEMLLFIAAPRNIIEDIEDYNYILIRNRDS